MPQPISSQSTAIAAARPRPFLKWAGGKSQLLDQYEEYFPTRFQTYHEPFLGGGAVFFHLADRIESAILSDVNAELVNAYCCIRDRVDDVLEQLDRHRTSHGSGYYYQVRSSVPKHPVERAARLIYLNKTCFNGLYRENSKGEFNVPIGRYKNPGIFDPSLLYAASQALQVAEIRHAGFEEVLADATTPEDFVYFDPPYHPISTTSSFTSYSRNDFGTAEHLQLSKAFEELATRGVQAMLSNSDCLFVRELYQNFNIYTIYAVRMINCKAQKRGKIPEVLVTSYEPNT